MPSPASPHTDTLGQGSLATVVKAKNSSAPTQTPGGSWEQKGVVTRACDGQETQFLPQEGFTMCS